MQYLEQYSGNPEGGFSRAFSRRVFFSAAGTGLLASSFLGSYFGCRPSLPPSGMHPDALTASTATGSDKTAAGQVTLPTGTKAATEKQDAPLPDILPPDQRVGYAIVGLGKLAVEEIMPAFGASHKSRITALVSGSPEKARTLAQQYGIPEKNIYNYQTYDQLADNPDVQAIYIVLPNGLHHEFTLRGAKAGKHILCEKPMANSSKEAREMIEACQKAGKKLMIAYRIQYEPHNREVQKLVRDKKYGAVKFIDAVNGQNTGDPNQWRLKKALAGGGALPDVGIYCLNTIRFLLGEEPTAVFATQYSTPDDIRFKEVEENVAFQLTFPSGIIANCLTGYGNHEARRYRVYAEKGWFGLDPAFAYKGLEMERSHAEGKTEILEKVQITEKNQFALEIDHFSDCILNNKTPYTPGEEGLQDHRLIEAIYESAKTRKPVSLEKIDKTDAFRGSEPES